jgi:hypothetical protein
MAYETKIRLFTLLNRTTYVLFLKAVLQEKNAAGGDIDLGLNPHKKKN